MTVLRDLLHTAAHDLHAVTHPTPDAVPDAVPDSPLGLGISEAARVLGVSREAVRQRIRRGTIPATKVDGNWYVQINRPDTAAGTATAPPHGTPTPTATDAATGTSPGTANGYADHDSRLAVAEAEVRRLEELARVVQTENARLWAEMETRTEELRRKDHIIAVLAQRQMTLPLVSAEPTTPGDPLATTTPSPRRAWWQWWRW